MQKIPYNWEVFEVAASAKLQIGKRSSSLVGVYIDGLVGLGGEKRMI